MSTLHDCRMALRGWLAAPVLAAVVLLTLAIGIGTTTTAFTLAYEVLVRPLPFPDPERLVWISNYNTTRDSSTDETKVRMSQLLDWQRNLTTFELVAAIGSDTPDLFIMTESGTPERLEGLEVTQRFLPMLGARPAYGRLFSPGDDREGSVPLVVLSHELWQRRFKGDPAIVGRSLTIDNRPHTVVGVLTAEFPLARTMFPGRRVDIYVPLIRRAANDEIGFFMNVFGRLKPGVTLAQADADLARRHAVMVAERNYLKVYAQEALPLANRITSEARTPLLLVFGGVGATLLMVCGNLANLLLVRAGGRSRDLRLRMALGASTRRIVGESMTESGLMTAGGGAGGVAIALALMEWLRGASWLDLPRLPAVEVTGASMTFTVALCAAVTFLFGLLPVLQLRRLDVAHALRSAASATPDRRAARVQQASLIAQIAFTLMLTAAAVLMLRSVISLLRVDPGYRPDSVFAIRLDPAGRLRPPDRVPFFSRVLDQVAPLPGLQAAAMSYNVPMDGRSPGWDLAVPGQPFVPGNDVAAARMVSPGYFQTVGIPIRDGRDFTPRDTRESPLVVAVNETLARRIGANAVGQTINVSGRPREIVAVVADVRHNGLDAPAGWEFYVPYTQAPGIFGVYDLVVRTSSIGAVMPSIRRAVWSVDRAQAIAEPIPLNALIDRSTQRRRTLAWLLGGLGGAALLLAGLGIYGLVGYRLTQRRRELAIRIAVGAPRRRVEATVLCEIVVCVALGIGTGLPLALAAGTALQAFLFSVAPRDAQTLVATCAIVAMAAFTAAYLPARRAGRIDPISALRAD